ncbi:MAG: hypothetical protein K0R13_388 [Propionibacteriaceae bacterium]|jgi:hypothetical protein|nr:hypothetical protein [Propionibacteriaceae bacterium]
MRFQSWRVECSSNKRSVGYPPGVRMSYPQNPVRPNDCQCSSLGSQRKTFKHNSRAGGSARSGQQMPNGRGKDHDGHG